MMATIIFTHENGGLVHQILAQIIGTFFYHHQLPNLEWTLIFWTLVIKILNMVIF